jgi:hypothetical protein
MYIRSVIIFALLSICNFLAAQDTVKVRRPDDDRFCTLVICIRGRCFADSLPDPYLRKEQKLELRINDKCNAKKRSDVFVNSFEILAVKDGKTFTSVAQSSFFTEPQMKILRSLKAGELFSINNVTVHAPDGFRKIENIKIIIK